MNNKNAIIPLLIFVCLLNFISGATTVNVGQQFQDGLYIQSPNDNILNVGKDYLFEFHIFNLSNSLSLRTGISCEFYLYDETGDHKYVSTTGAPDAYGDYYFNISKGNFTNQEHYYYYVYCNNSLYGGFAQQILYIEQFASGYSLSQSVLNTGLIFLMVILNVILFYFIFVLNSDYNRNGNGEIIGINFRKYIRLILIFFSYFLVMLTLNLTVASATQLSGVPQFLGTIGLIFEIMMKISIFWICIMVFVIGYNVIKDMNISKQIKKSNRFKING